MATTETKTKVTILTSAYRIKGYIDLLPGKGELPRLQFPKIAHLGHERPETAARPFGLFQHLSLAFRQWPGLFPEQHSEIAAYHRDRRPQFMNRQRHDTGKQLRGRRHSGRLSRTVGQSTPTFGFPRHRSRPLP